MDAEKLTKANSLERAIKDKKEYIKKLKLAATTREEASSGGHYGPELRSSVRVHNSGWQDVIIAAEDKAKMFVLMVLAEAEAELKKLEEEFAAL